MKFCQSLRKNNKIFGFFILFLLLTASFVFSKNCVAQVGDWGAAENTDYVNMAKAKCSGQLMGEDTVKEFVDPQAVKVSDLGVIVNGQKLLCVEQKGWIQNAMDQIKSWNLIKLDDLKKSIAAQAFKAAVKNFLNNLAADTATYLATGNWGQSPMFETRNFGTVMKDAADNAAGTFIEKIGKENGLLQFNLCSPNPKVLLKINLGLSRNLGKPKAPACTFSKMTQNWETALKSKTFLNDFQDMFNPWSNDLGIALTLQTGMTKNINTQADLALLEAQKNWGIKDVIDPISKFIKTPGVAVTQQMGALFYDENKKELTFTGDITADAIGIFINTLASKLMDQWLKKGLVTNFAGGSLTNPEAQNTGEGVTGAENRLRAITEPNFKVRGDYNILAELATCPDPNKAGPTNCVIDERFRQAIENRLTVKQALDQGYLNGNGIFGFTADGLEPKYYEGYPYRSMLILRKFRIIPLGWEVAAQKIKDRQAEVGGTKNLKDLVDCSLNGAPEWCAGLVDPNWVLKAPQNFCKREGAGPEIISQEVTGEGADSSLSVLRDETYCADEQSCIKEKTDGSCQLYGYCTEERRQWDFNAKSCEPRDNTCQTFKPAGGEVVSYLQNTLDYGICNAGNAGCAKYATTGTYNTTGSNVSWDGSKNTIYLNKNAETCETADEGCHEFIRLNPGGGANLLVNSGFEQALLVGAWEGDRRDEAYQGAHSLKLQSPLIKKISVGTSAYNLTGEEYVLSFYAKGCFSGDTFSLGGASNAGKTASLNAGGDWTKYSLSHAFTGNEGYIKISLNSSNCLIDNLKLERGGQATSFSDYAAAGSPSLIYEKVAPSYLNCSGANPPVVCGDFARYCTADEAGCQLYTSVSDGSKIPAKVGAQDYCPAECVGYDTYLQSESNFDSSRQAYFIPKTARACSAEAAGCDQFTNLDEVAKGGEGVEYYTDLRQCVKPATAACAEFYTWEGSDESGFQLKVMSLDADGGAPALTAPYDENICSELIYNLPTADPRYNDDCRQFYNRAGIVFYRLYSHTKTCTDDCHPYRRTELNVDENIASAGACSGADKHWDGANSQCVVCKNGGVWSAENQACLYMAIPGEGKICAAAQNNCREYTGNAGNNIRQIFSDDFNNGTVGAWQGSVTPATEASSLQNNIGRSLKVDKNTSRPIGNAVSKGRDYVLKFLAKASAAADLTAELNNGTAAASFTAPAKLTTSWQIYEINLVNLNTDVSASEVLRLSANENFYLDNIILTEIVDRYYLIKGTWQTPVSCDSELDGTPHDLYMLRCAQYSDRASKTHYLRQFSRLCSESSVGCELMIDTQNSANPYNQGFENAGSAVTVPEDSFAYVVYDQAKLCGAEAKGCSRLGKSYKYENAEFYGDVYLKNNPDKYNTILCGADAVGCQAWAYDNGASDNGEKYFKDSGDMVCQWRQQKAGTGQSYGWYKKAVKRCGGNGGAVCLADNDCSANVKCQIETADTLCPTSDNKTLGVGGVGGRVSQPGADAYGNWAGICQAAASGCGEYLDPVSSFNTNVIFNGDFAKIAASNWDGWKEKEQNVILEPNTIYRLARVNKDSSELRLSGCPNALYEIKNDDALPRQILVASKTFITVDSASYANSKIFYYKGDTAASCTISVDDNGGPVELKKVVIDYQLSQNLDKGTCNGRVNFDQGCVLFNERKQDGSALAKLNWDADTANVSPAVAEADKDSNIILKVTPDRVCNKWLACKSYIKDETGNNVCFDVGLCDAVDENGNCSSFLNSSKTNQLVDGTAGLGADGISNLSGYAKVGILGGSITPSDYYPLGAMKQYGDLASLVNGGFEYYGANGYPIGWSWSGQAATNKSWNANIFSVINNPVAAQSEGIGYAPEGSSFLKLGSSYDATSENIDVMPKTDYIITAYVNTKNLKSGQAKIDIVYNPSTSSTVITQDLGNDWKFQMGKFNTGANTQINIKLYSDAGAMPGSEGNFYFDEVKIRPALNSKDNWYTKQSCRLYPKNDALSCDYYETSGKRQKGWYGYCLEYDRPPGDPNVCLLWYPIDKVKGDGIEEGAGYQGRFPVYYCADINLSEETIHTAEKTGGSQCSSVDFDIAKDFSVPEWQRSYLTTNFITKIEGVGVSVVPPETTASTNPGGGNWTHTITVTYKKDGSVSNINYGWAYSDCEGEWTPKTSIAITYKIPYCKKLVQTVTASGQNKYWSGRMYQGTDYKIDCLDQTLSPQKCEYNSDYTPFGSIVYPAPSTNPYDWVAQEGNLNSVEPLTSRESGARIGQIHKAEPVNYIQRIFAKSYGTWQWQGYCSGGSNNGAECITNSNCPGSECINSRYRPIKGEDWGLPETICSYLTRPVNSEDYCAIQPTITNVKVNGQSGEINISKNNFINLTFNSKVDSQQLPLVMYAVDWGDGESTKVTGVEMRDRPNPDVPHSLYHLYSYWDLKAKANQGKLSNGSCGTDASGNFCRVKPSVQIKDNWGWCNGGKSMNDCLNDYNWVDFGNWIVVREIR